MSEYDKFAMYYSLVDYLKGEDYYPKEDEDEKDSDDAFIFKLKCPFVIGPLLGCLKPIINNMCMKLKTKSNVEKEIKKIKDSPNSTSFGKDIYNKVCLVDLINADYTYLKYKFFLKWDLVPNEDFFYKTFSHIYAPEISFSFTLKEFYDMIITRAINILINNFFDST